MSNKSAIIVNLSATSVSVSQFSSKESGLILESIFVEEIPSGVIAEGEWLDAISLALGKLVKQHGIRGKVAIIVPAFLLLQKQLKVAQVEKTRQAQIIAFEAQTAIPYPLHEVVWDSQLISSDGVEAEVLLFALRTEIATKIANLVIAAGLRPLSIQAAPLLDSQAFRQSTAAASRVEEVLIVNVGARSSTFSFVGSSGINIQTATNIGGNLLTQGVSDNTGLPFNTAEAMKVGYFSGVLQMEETDPQVAVIQTNAQSFVRRLAQDINRRLINVRRGANGRQPVRVLITGRSSQVPRLDEQLRETLRLPVEVFNPLSSIILGPNVSNEAVKEAKLQITEVVGEAARLVLPQFNGVNLIPREIAEQLAFNTRKPWFLFAATLAASSPLWVWLGLGTSKEWNAERVKVVQTEINELNSQLNSIKGSHLKTIELNKNCREIESIVANRNNWPTFLADLQERINSCKHTWIDDLQIKYETISPTASESGKPPSSQIKVTKIVLGVRFLFSEVSLDEKQYRSKAERSHITQILEKIRKSPFVSEVPENEIVVTETLIRGADRIEIRTTPKATITLVINNDKLL